MIISLFLYLIAMFLDTISILLPVWQLWPNALLTGMSYFFQQLIGFNFIFPIDQLFIVILFIVNFEVLYLSAKLLTKLFGYIRGSGSGLDL